MNIVTFYADCRLPDQAQRKQAGFDWRQAIKWLKRSAEAQGYGTQVVTDEKTELEAWIRVGNAKSSGLMLWILEAQAEAMRRSESPSVMVSPDSLVMGPLGMMFGDWDVTLLTRRKPKPIVNSVIAFRPSEKVSALWGRVIEHAWTLPPESLEWGADIDALVSYMGIEPLEDSVREIDGVRVRFMPMHSVFTSVDRVVLSPPKTPIWDFKGSRKSLMAKYAGMM